MLSVMASLERLASDKHSTLLRTFVNYGRKKSFNIGPSWTTLFGSSTKASDTTLSLSVRDQFHKPFECVAYGSKEKYMSTCFENCMVT